MRNLKRALSLALASVMLVGMMVVGTSAASYPDVDASKHDIEAIDVLEAIGVMKGDAGTGNFRPDDKVSRNEMAVVMARLILGNYAADSYVGTHPFTDVPSWADRYVAACYNSGIINGTSATTYSGTSNVTAVQAAAMMLRALGYESLSKPNQKWDVPVAAKANEINLFEGLTGSGTAQLTRNEIASLSLNALKADVVNTERTGFDMEIPGVGTINSAVTYKRVERTSEGTANYAGGNTADDGYGYQQLCEKLYGTDLKLVSGQNDDLQRPASTWRYKNDDIITIADEADYVFVLDDNYTSKASITDTEDLVQELTDKDDLVADAAATYKLNGANNTSAGIKAKATYGTVIEVYLKSGDSKKFDKVVAYYYTLDKITDVDTDVKDNDAKKGVSAYVDFDNAGTINNDKIANYNADTYEKDAYVAIILKDEEIIDSFIPEVEETSVSTVKVNSYITAGSTRYYPTVDYDNAVKTISLSSASNVSTKSDDSYAIYLDKNGYMLGLEAIEASAASLDDVYYVDDVYAGAPTTAAGGTKTPHYAQLVALADGTISQVELEQQDKATATSATISGSDYVTRVANYKGKLVTISDKEWTANNNTPANTADDVKYKKNNNKFDLELWDHTANNDYDVYTEVKFTEGDELKTDSTRVAINAKKNDNGVDTVAAAKPIRLNSSTKYVFAEDSGEDLDVKTATGGVAYEFSVANLLGSGSYASYDKAIVVTEADKAYALYMIIPCADSKLGNTFSEDVIYIHDNAKDVGDGYFVTEVYLADGTKVARDDKDAWKFDDSVTLSSDTFYTYATNEDGYIEVEDADLLNVGSNYVWEDETGAVTAANVAAGDYEDGQKLLTITKSNKVEDIKVDGAKFVDLHDKDDEYENAINSLSRLMDLLENGKVSSATISMNVSKDGAKTIFLVTAPGCSHSWGSDSVITAATCTAEGSKRQTCATCGATRTVAIPATGHTVDSYTSNASGHSGTCSVCGATLTNEAHTYEWVQGSGSLTTTDTAKHVKVCSVCDYEDTATAANHTPAGAFTSVSDTNHKQACSACGADVTGAHNFGAWDPAKPEDCTQAYDRTHTCSDCNHSVTENVAGGSHTGTQGSACSVCGKTIT